MCDYILELDEDQLKHIAKALDFYARIQTGQLSELVNPYMVPLPNSDYTDVDEKVNALKKSMFPDLPDGAYYSIKSSYIPDEVRQIIDIYEVIRYHFILNNENIDIEKEKKLKPINWSSEKTLPVLKKKGTEND